MAAMPESVKVKIIVEGADDAVAAIERCRDDLRSSCERLVAMGWTLEMAEKFVGEIADKVARSMIKVLPNDAGR